MRDNATANKPAAWRVDVEGIGSIMPICRDWVEVQGICNRFGDRVFGVAPLYEETKTLSEAWIPVSERLPEHNDAIWVYGQDVFMGEYWQGSGFQSYGASVDREGLKSETLHGVTHWMEIDEPEPPEVK